MADTVTLEEVVNGLKDIFNENVMKFFSSESAEDLAKFSEILLNNTAVAISTGDELTLASVKRTMRSLAELGRVAVVNASWDAVEAALEYFVKIVRGVLIGVAAKVIIP